MVYGTFLIILLKKQQPLKIKSRLVITECTGYIFWQLFLRQLYLCLPNLARSDDFCPIIAAVQNVAFYGGLFTVGYLLKTLQF